jgi:hypothetical protein
MPQDNDRQSSNSRSSRERETPRDHQQIADDNQQSGVVDTEQIRDRTSDMEQAEGSGEDAGGISNRGLGDERESQSRVPPRGESKEDDRA